MESGPNGIRIRVCGLKGRRPSPLDDGATMVPAVSRNVSELRSHAGAAGVMSILAGCRGNGLTHRVSPMDDVIISVDTMHGPNYDGPVAPIEPDHFGFVFKLYIIDTLRRRLGLTQAALAEQLDVLIRGYIGTVMMRGR